METIAECIDQVLKAIDTDELDTVLKKVKDRVAELTVKYPLPYPA